jgi:probable rRNA maturation factor
MPAPARNKPRARRDAGGASAIDVRVEAPGWRRALPDAAGRCRHAARAALDAAAPARTGSVLAILLTDDARMRVLNRRWRGVDRATNVLAFPARRPSGANRAAPAMAQPIGDVALAWPCVQREAKAQGKKLADHVSHLVVHAVLHVLGFDHDTPVKARRMERREIAVLAGLGIGDPYVSPGAP